MLTIGHHRCSRRSLQHVQQPSVAQLAWLYRLLAILDYCNWALKVHGTSSDSNLVGDHPWLGGTTYGAVNIPAGPSMATIFAVDGPAGLIVGGPSVA